MLARRFMWVAWPAFMLACILEVLVFAVIDPADLHWAGEVVPLSRMAVYTVSFFTFWLLGMVSSAFTVLLAVSAAELNRRPER